MTSAASCQSSALAKAQEKNDPGGGREWPTLQQSLLPRAVQAHAEVCRPQLREPVQAPRRSHLTADPVPAPGEEVSVCAGTGYRRRTSTWYINVVHRRRTSTWYIDAFTWIFACVQTSKAAGSGVVLVQYIQSYQTTVKLINIICNTFFFITKNYSNCS